MDADATPRAQSPDQMSPGGGAADDGFVPALALPVRRHTHKHKRSQSTSDLVVDEDEAGGDEGELHQLLQLHNQPEQLDDSTTSLLPPSDSMLQMYAAANQPPVSIVSMPARKQSVYGTQQQQQQQQQQQSRSASRARSLNNNSLKIVTPVSLAAPPNALQQQQQNPQQQHQQQQQQHVINAPRKYSFWDYLKGQLLSSDYSNDNPEYMNVKKERIENFLSVPYEFEKLMLLGYMICLDSFLYVFTILPARICIALKTIVESVFWRSTRLSSSQKCDLMKGLLVGICCYMLENVDGSRLYHSVRGQSTIKLYRFLAMMFWTSLFSKTTTNPTPALSLRRLNRVTHFSLALLYVFSWPLNVAINSYNNALLSLLLSNQFIEIKGSVFKKFERENLFQLSCSDIVERFQLSIFLLIISVRNLVELTGATVTTAASYNPFTLAAITDFFRMIVSYTTSLISAAVLILSTETPFEFLHRVVTQLVPEYLETIFDTLPVARSSAIAFFDSIIYQVLLPPHVMSIVQYLAFPVLAVLGTELLVDWLKHAFITKFNQLKVGLVYKKYRETLCRDLVVGMDGEMGFIDKSPHVARRIGFVSVPLACLVVRVTLQTLRMLCTNGECGIAPWTLDWRPPRGSVSRAIGDTVACLVGQGDLHCLKGVWGRVVGSVWLTVRMEVIAGVAVKIAILYFILLMLKLVVGYELIRMAQKKIYEIAVDSSGTLQSNVTPVAVPTAAAATTAGAAIASGVSTIPSTPTNRLRKGSAVSLVELERQSLQLQQNNQHGRDSSVSSNLGGSLPSVGVQPQRRPSHMARGGSNNSAANANAVISDTGTGVGMVALTGNDMYGAPVPSHILQLAGGHGSGGGVVGSVSERDSNLVAVGGVFVAKDDKLDRVDRFAMVKSRIV
ncbi:eukaryotic membrane protein family-domain-containing protein [Obelidium mucronatum]|nr:eukaryotic membrane protein family-domain-containing protein [Obelidium mucronatum]